MKNSEKASYFNTAKNISYGAFENLVLHKLDKVTPIKQKYNRGNLSPFMNIDIHMAKISRIRLRNRLLRDTTLMNRLAY